MEILAGQPCDVSFLEWWKLNELLMRVFTGCGKTQNSVILSEAKNLSFVCSPILKSKRDSSLRSEWQNKTFFPQRVQ
jgi:hypothetical protein